MPCRVRSGTVRAGEPPFLRPLDPEGFDRLADDLRAGRLAETVPTHGVLSRVERNVGLPGLAAKSSPSAKSSAPKVSGAAKPKGATKGSVKP